MKSKKTEQQFSSTYTYNWARDWFSVAQNAYFHLICANVCVLVVCRRRRRRRGRKKKTNRDSIGRLIVTRAVRVLSMQFAVFFLLFFIHSTELINAQSRQIYQSIWNLFFIDLFLFFVFFFVNHVWWLYVRAFSIESLFCSFMHLS